MPRGEAPVRPAPEDDDMRFLAHLAAALALGVVLAAPAAEDKKDGKKDGLDLDKIPKKVMAALKAKFPKAKITKATKEKDGDEAVYDIEFTQDGKKFEADIKADGTIQNYEVEIPAKDLPEAAGKAIEKKYPKSTIRTVLKITDIKDGKEDTSRGFEVNITTDDKRDIEVTVTAEGKITEDTGEKKEKKDEKKKG
jgi:hypothetical protein